MVFQKSISARLNEALQVEVGHTSDLETTMVCKVVMQAVLSFTQGHEEGRLVDD